MKKKVEVPQRKSEKKFYNFFFQTSSRLTDFFPDMGARFLNELTGTVYANPFLIRKHLQKDRRNIQDIKRFDRILVIADLNIGDAINVQTAVSALRQFFPRAEIDYVISRKAFNLIDGNPEISRVLPLLTGTPFPNKVDYENVRNLVSANAYDVIFNFCPFFKEKTLFPPRQSLINFSTMAELLVRNELSRTGINHIGYRIYQYVSDLVTPVVGREVKRSFPGPLVTLPAYAVEEAGRLLFSSGIDFREPLVLYNPDATSRFTLIPFPVQVQLLNGLAQAPVQILLGRGRNHPGLESRLLEALPLPRHRRIMLVPGNLSLETYAALIDYSQAFISGDTGPLHIAAARRYRKEGYQPLTNSTAIFSVFGATPSHVYGYDSFHPLYMSSNQDAPSRVYKAESQCRNITCINKMAKSCKTVHCFHELSVDLIVEDIQRYFKTISRTKKRKRQNYKGIQEVGLSE